MHCVALELCMSRYHASKHDPTRHPSNAGQCMLVRYALHSLMCGNAVEQSTTAIACLYLNGRTSVVVQVRVVASLPCYSADNVDKQRGRGVFERSIEGLRMLNAVGYGQPDSGLFMDLVYNPGVRQAPVMCSCL